MPKEWIMVMPALEEEQKTVAPKRPKKDPKKKSKRKQAKKSRQKNRKR